MTHKKKAILIAVIDIALMTLCTLTLYEWNGVFVVIGILAGGGIALGSSEWQKGKEES